MDYRIIMTGLTVVLGTVVPALMIGKIGAEGLKGIARNPEASGEIRTSMILAIAFAEAIAIYTLVVALIIKFV